VLSKFGEVLGGGGDKKKRLVFTNEKKVEAFTKRNPGPGVGKTDVAGMKKKRGDLQKST